MIKHMIKTQYIHPPIPVRTTDWAAWFDGFEEENMLMGYGETEAEAVRDLMAAAIDAGTEEDEVVMDMAMAHWQWQRPKFEVTGEIFQWSEIPLHEKPPKDTQEEYAKKAAAAALDAEIKEAEREIKEAGADPFEPSEEQIQKWNDLMKSMAPEESVTKKELQKVMNMISPSDTPIYGSTTSGSDELDEPDWGFDRQQKIWEATLAFIQDGYGRERAIFEAARLVEFFWKEKYE